MAGSIRMMGAALCLLSGSPAMAAELTPWLGSADQTPFQLDPNTMVAVTFAADPSQTGSLSAAPCPPKGCVHAMGAAKSTSVATGVPQK